MNRRSFLKSAALAAVAVPVVGLPAVPALSYPPQLYEQAKPVVWTIKAYRRCNPVLGSHCTILAYTEEDLVDTLKDLDDWGYRVMLYVGDMYVGHT